MNQSIMRPATPLTAHAIIDTPLRAVGLTIGYRGRRAPDRVLLADLDLALHAGELVCLLGPNGVGKSTLLRTLCGMQPPLHGTITLDGRDLSRLPAAERARILGVVLTDRTQPGLMTVRELVSLGRYPYTDWSGRLSAADERAVDAAIASVGGEMLSDRQITDLSDGERQKFMIARALAQQPAIILLDEPTAYLDLPRRIEIMLLLRRLAAEQETALVVSTHDLDLALHMSDTLWLMPGDGTLHTGTPRTLIDSGALGRAFAGVQFRYDDARGDFSVSYSR
ncbi:MAG: ABC transporter ATP-binding protein [Chloroflexota bacterium]|nr:ABC transporter ATP-binding protein [Chloroflexota bacterium]